MTDRPVMTEQGLSIMTVVFGNAAGVAPDTLTAVEASGRGNLGMKNLLSASLIAPGVGTTSLTVVWAQAAPLGAGNIQIESETQFRCGSAVPAAPAQLIMLCQMGTLANGALGEKTAAPKMTEHSLDIFTIVYSGTAHIADATWNIPASFRGGQDIGELVAGFLYVAAGTVTSLTVLAPGTANPGAGNMRLETTAENNIKVGSGLLNTGTLVLYCRAGKSFGPLTARPAMTEKGLSTMFMVYAGGNQAGGAYGGGTTQAIPPSVRAGHELLEIRSAEIHAIGGVTTELTVVTAAPVAATDIQLVNSTSFCIGVGAPSDLPLTDQLWMHVRVVDAQI